MTYLTRMWRRCWYFQLVKQRQTRLQSRREGSEEWTSSRRSQRVGWTSPVHLTLFQAKQSPFVDKFISRGFRTSSQCPALPNSSAAASGCNWSACRRYSRSGTGLSHSCPPYRSACLTPSASVLASRQCPNQPLYTCQGSPSNRPPSRRLCPGIRCFAAMVHRTAVTLLSYSPPATPFGWGSPGTFSWLVCRSSSTADPLSSSSAPAAVQPNKQS